MIFTDENLILVDRRVSSEIKLDNWLYYKRCGSLEAIL